MKKAFKVSLWEDEEGEEEAEADELESNLDDDEEIQDIEDVDYGDVFRDLYRQPCTIHSLQLLVKDILNLFPAFAQ